MHRHKIVAQILLILSILNSAFAVPVLLQKRPNEPQAVTPVLPDAPPSIDLPSSSQSQLPGGPERPFPQWPSIHQHSESMASSGYLEYSPTPSGNLRLLTPTVNTGHSEIQPDTSAAAATDSQHGEIQPYTLPPANPQHSEIQPYISPPASPQHGEIQPYISPPASPQHGEIQPHTSPPASSQHGEIQPYTSPPASPAHPGPQSVTTAPQPVNKAPSKAAWRQKIMTPEKIKATKFAAGAALLATAYMGLLFPEIMSNDNTTKS